MWKFPVLALALCACHDPGRDTLALARGQYDALTQAGTPVQSRDYDRIIQTLTSIPDGSRSKPEAQALIRSIEQARQNAPPAPPVKATDALSDTQAECDRLKSELKPLELAARTRKQELIDACERRLLELKEAHP